MSNSVNIPQKFTFSCSADSIFIHDGRDEKQPIYYSDIAVYSQQLPDLLQKYKSDDHPFILQSENSVEYCCLIAGLFIAGIPFCSVDPTWTPGQVLESTKEVPQENYLNSAHIRALHAQWLAFLSNHEPSHKELSLTVKTTPFAFLFTSGSSSRPKKIPLRHAQLWAAFQATQAQVQLSPNMSWGLCLPLHHIGALSIVLKSLLSHSSISLSSSSDVQCWNSWLNGRHNCQVVSMVPTQLHNWLEYNRTQKYPSIISKAFRFIILGGGPTNAADVEEALKYGWPILLSYGMTETFAHICSIPASELQKPLKDPLPVGLMHPSHSVRIRYEKGDYDPLIWLMGSQIFTPESSQNLMLESFDEEGWFCTGDIGKMDEKGLLYIQARRLDRIISGGENVAVDWVIDCLKQYPIVQDCAIIGVADPKWGQKVVAFIVPNQSILLPDNQKNIEAHSSFAITELEPVIAEKLLQQCREKSLPLSHHPKEIYYLSALPRNSLGKLNMPRLQNLYASTRGK
tara:strand:+ start:1584 stop:3122 length:1539 start_codon:yes stop_codon:yes gene_type:complete